MAGKGPELLVSPTDDMGKILSSLHGVSVHGKTNFAAGIQIAQLALKHRRNKHGGQRIIIFVSSPIEDEVRLFPPSALSIPRPSWQAILGIWGLPCRLLELRRVSPSPHDCCIYVHDGRSSS